MNNSYPEWQKGWKIDDIEWVENRKLSWNEIKKSPVLKNKFKKYEIDKVRTYFLTGSAFNPIPEPSEWTHLVYDPDTKPLPVTCNTLLQCWLSVDGMDWGHIKLNAYIGYYDDSRSYFRYLLRNNYPSQGSLFNGRDNMIYRFFTPNRCRPEDFPDDGRFFKRAIFARRDLQAPIDLFLNEQYNSESLAPSILDEWCDSIVPAFQGYSDKNQALDLCRIVSRTLSKAIDIVKTPEGYVNEQVTFSNEMIARFEKMELGEGMNLISKLLSNDDIGD